jgi:hypothetical protein
MTTPMKNLDCHTKRGRKFIVAQHDTTKILKRIFPSLIFVHSANATQAEDCYIYCNKKLSGVAEIKCREYINRRTQLPYKLDTIRKQYDNEYLITKTKIDNLRMISEQRKIPSFIFLNLPSEKKIVRFKITNANGDLVMPIQSRTTRTMYSCNNYKGTTERENAFLPIDNKNVMLISY